MSDYVCTHKARRALSELYNGPTALRLLQQAGFTVLQAKDGAENLKEQVTLDYLLSVVSYARSNAMDYKNMETPSSAVTWQEGMLVAVLTNGTSQHTVYEILSAHADGFLLVTDAGATLALSRSRFSKGEPFHVGHVILHQGWFYNRKEWVYGVNHKPEAS